MKARKYFKLHWPEEPVPNGEPTWLYYEVEVASDNVLRTVDEMEDGRLKKASLARENQIDFPSESLVEGAFTEAIKGMDYDLISAKQFESLYSQATFAPK